MIEYVIETAGELKCRLDLRWIEHGYGHYLTHVQGGTVDWRDMVKFHMMNNLTYFDHAPKAYETGAADICRPDRHQREITVALEIAQMAGLTAEDRVRLWETRTGLSRATYYRRCEAGLAQQTEG